MLVTCTHCKSPVFVSGAAMAHGEAVVTCGSCKMQLSVKNGGAMSSGALVPEAAPPSPAAQAIELPSYAAPKVPFAAAAARVSFEPLHRALDAKGGAASGSATASSASLASPPVAAASPSPRFEAPAAFGFAEPEPATSAVDSGPQRASAASPAGTPIGRGDEAPRRETVPAFLAAVPAARTETDEPSSPVAHGLGVLQTPAAPPEPAPQAAPTGAEGEELTSTQEFYLARVRATAPAPRGAADAELELDEWAPRRWPRTPTFLFAGVGIAALALVGLLLFAARDDAGNAAGDASLPGAASAGGAAAARMHYRRANQHLAADRAALAIEELQKCLRAHPGFGVAYRSLGVAYMQLGRERAAIDAYARFAQLEPAHPDAAQAKQIVESFRRRMRSGR